MIVREELRKSDARVELLMKREENLWIDGGWKCVGGGKKKERKRRNS